MGVAHNLQMHSPLPEDLTGSRVGRFRILRKLGSGGMGEVYYAEDTTLQRAVALKRVARRLGSDAGARQRILREAQHASCLSSEYIARVHDVLEENGELFLVMEFVEGETLRQRLQRPLSLEQFFEIAAQCAEALKSAHEHGVVHCDIKPENIMLTPGGQVKVLDFGLANHLPRSDESTTMDRANLLGGTAAYMSPEVLLEKLPDARTDIFSLGVVFYEMLTARHPFFAGSFVATSERILHEWPKEIRRINPSVPDGLERVVHKAMEKDLAKRYASAGELVDDLRAVRAGTSPRNVEARRSGEILQGKHWFLAFAAGLVVVVAALAIYRWTNHEPVLAERGWLLISDFETSGDGTIPDKGVREGLTIALQQSRYVNVFPRARAYEVLRRMRKTGVTKIDEAVGREICQRENLQVLLTGSVQRMGQMIQVSVQGLDPVRGNVLFAEQERFTGENQYFDRTDALAVRVRRRLGESMERIEKSSRPLAKVTTTSLEALQLYSQANDAREQGDDAQLESLLQGALQLDSDFAMAHLRLGQHYAAVVSKTENALAEVERAYQLRQNVTDREQRKIEAEYYRMHERYEDEAQSLTVLVSLYPDDEEGHQALADAYYDLNQLDKAAFESKEVLRLNPTSAPAYRNLALYLARANRSNEALKVYQEAQFRNVDSPQMHWGVGLAYLDQGNVASAREEFQRIGQRTATDRELQELCLTLADLYEGRLRAAHDDLSRRLQASGAQGGLQLARRYLIARIDLFNGDTRGALVQADAILKTPGAGLQTSDLVNAGMLYARAGNTSKARDVLRRLDRLRKSAPSSWNRSSYHDLEGEIELAAGKPDDAGKAFGTAAQEYPHVLAHAGLARVYQEQRRWDDAAREWEQVLLRRGEILQNGFPPDLVTAHVDLARVYEHLNNEEKSRSEREEAVRMWKQADQSALLRETRHDVRN